MQASFELRTQTQEAEFKAKLLESKQQEQRLLDM